MGQLDNTPSNPIEEGKAAREVLRSVTQNLRALQDDLSGQLNQDITRLQGTKHRLLNDIEILEEEYQSLRSRYEALKSEHEVELSRKQLVQQQVWAKRLAQALATNLQTRLTETIYNTASINGKGQSGSLQNAYQLLASLDASLNDTLHSLQQDLNSYQSSLSQQISRMQSMEQQGETILEALINRLSLQLQAQMARPQSISGIQGANGVGTPHNLYGYQPATSQQPYGYQPATSPPAERQLKARPTDYHQSASVKAIHSDRTKPPAAQPSHKPSSKPQTARLGSRFSTFQKGLIFIILSTLALSVHNVLVGIVGYGGQILGRFPIDAIFQIDILLNSLILLWLRMVVVLPLMAFVAGRLYPDVWKDIRQFLTAENKRPVLQVIASGCFLFVSQVLIYKAISEIGPGVAVTLLFMYPLITVPLAWFLFGDRPTILRAMVMFAITIGVVFTALPSMSTDLSGVGVSPWGIVTGLLSSAAFALYLISVQLSFNSKLHPVPVSLIQFTTIFTITTVIAGGILVGATFFGLEMVGPSSNSGLGVAVTLLGGLTLLGYLFNNYGVRQMGAAQASIVASSGPVLTAIMAYLIIPGERSMLQFIQWIGVILVTLGVLALSVERLNKRQPGKAKRIRT